MLYGIMSGSYQAPFTSSSVEKYKTDKYDDDSFDESFTSYSDEFLQLSPALKLQPRLSSTFKQMHHNSDDNGDPSNNDPSSNEKAAANLSVWERWYVAKLQLEKEKSILKKEEAKKKKEEELIKKKLENDKKLLALQRHEEWLEEKLMQLKLQKKKKERQEKIKKEIELEKAAKVKAESEIKYKQWLESIKEMEDKKHAKEERQRYKEIKKREEKQQRAKECYQKWLLENKHRFAALKTKKPPTPSYINPIPWVAPNQDATRRRPDEPTASDSTREQHRPLQVGQSFTAKRCSTPKPRSRGLNTHTPMRTGKVPQRSLSLVRVHTPLRFSGYQPKPNSGGRPPSKVSLSRRSVTASPAPRPRTGMQSSQRYTRAKCCG